MVWVAPKPGHGGGGNWPAGDRRRRPARLFERVWNRFETNFTAQESVPRMHRAVPDGINIGVVGAARRIDDNPVVNAEPGAFRELRVGNETDADHHKIGGKRLTAGAGDRA